MQYSFTDWRERLSRVSVGSGLTKWVEAFLVLLLIVQIARLFWALVTPAGMVGEWRTRQPAILPVEARQALFTAFDPFFRSEGATSAPAQVTSLALQLFGTRINEGSGQGSAIIATPDGVQGSYVVGDEVMPGVVLKQVAYDHVVLDRGGALENLFLDQSADGGAATAPNAAGAQPAASPTPAPTGPAAKEPLTADDVVQNIGFAPRSAGPRVTGIAVSQTGAADIIARAGLQNGDVITQINGRPVASAADIQAFKAQLKPGANLSLIVERGSATLPISLVLGGNQ
jgi:general secretion pathway protein C